MVRGLRSYKPVWGAVAIVGLFQIAYAVGHIYRSSFVVEGHRYYSLLDDAFISMKYAANLAQGHGLVWNQGERVEGYTNFLWTLILAACHLPGLSPTATCLLVQALGVPVLWLCLISTVRLARASRLLPVTACIAVALVGTYYDLLFFSLAGMETGLVTCIVTMGLAEGVRCVRRRDGSAAPMLWLAIGMLVRPDVAWLVLWLGGFLLVTCHRRRWRILLGLALVVVVVAVHTLWRHAYYGEWLPNTYYLKATGWPLMQRLSTGLENSFHTYVSLALPLLLGLVSVLFRPRAWRLLLVGAVLGALAYQVYVGGDWLPRSRFVIPVSPALFVLAAEGIVRLAGMLGVRSTRRRLVAVSAGSVILSVLAINGVRGKEWFLLRPSNVNENGESVLYALAINRVSTPDVKVALGAAGAIPYYAHGRYFDSLGRCDSYIARLPAQPTPRLAGHNKRDYRYTLETYRPDIVLHGLPDLPSFWGLYRPVLVEIDGQRVVFAVRRDSTAVHLQALHQVSWRKAAEVLWASPTRGAAFRSMNVPP